MSWTAYYAYCFLITSITTCIVLLKHPEKNTYSFANWFIGIGISCPIMGPLAVVLTAWMVVFQVAKWIFRILISLFWVGWSFLRFVITPSNVFKKSKRKEIFEDLCFLVNCTLTGKLSTIYGAESVKGMEVFTFENLKIGDKFSTLSAVWKKISETQAEVIESSVHKIGEVFDFESDREVVVNQNEVKRN